MSRPISLKQLFLSVIACFAVFIGRADTLTLPQTLTGGQGISLSPWFSVMESPESALSAAKADASRGLDAGAFSRLKTERDTLRRAIMSGTVWTDGVS